jgi:DNA polymerase-4
MSLAEAYYRCPQAVFIEGNPHKYVHISGQVLRILKTRSPWVEPYSIDEAFVEMPKGTSLEDGAETARGIKEEIRSALGLTCSIGIAPNRYLAKMASGVQKPDGVTILDPLEFRKRFWPLPVNSLFGVGEKTAGALRSLGIETVRDLATWPVGRLRAAFGVNGEALKQIANGMDDSPVTPYYEESPQKSLGHEVTLEKNLIEEDPLLRILVSLCEEVGRDLRREGYRGRVITLRMRFPDFTTITRQHALSHRTNDSEEIYAVARDLFKENRLGRAIRLLGVSVGEIVKGTLYEEPLLFEPDHRRRDAVEAVDALKDRYGDHVVRKAAELRYDPVRKTPGRGEAPPPREARRGAEA